MFAKLSVIQRSLIGAFFALVGYGGWAFLVNYSHTAVVALKAALVQGSYSCVVTLLVSLLMEALYRGLIQRLPYSKRAAFLLTVVITCAVLYSSSWLINVLAGTPEVLKTVALGYILGTIYTISYTAGLTRLETIK